MRTMLNKVVLIGYSGHALVVADTLKQAGFAIVGYMDKVKSNRNFLTIPYLGNEVNPSDLEKIRNTLVFPAIGDNAIREKVIEFMQKEGFVIPIAVSPKANISKNVTIMNGTLICQGACVNPFASIGKGSIINTGSIIEHECQIGDYVHIAPGAVLLGDVQVGKNSFIGANSSIKQGVIIGKNVIVGAGSVVLNNIPDGSIVVGNPSKKIHV